MTPSAKSMKNLILSRSSWGTCLTLSSSFHHSATLPSSLWAAMPVAAMCFTTWRKKSGFSEESGSQFGLRQGGRTGSRGWRLLAPRSLLSKNLSLMLPRSDGGNSNLRRLRLLSNKKKLRQSFLSSRTSPQLPTLLLSSSWTRTQWGSPGKTSLRNQFTRSGSWSMPWENVLSADGNQAAWAVMPTNASGTTCTQRLPRPRSCPFSAQGLRILSNCSSQPP